MNKSILKIFLSSILFINSFSIVYANDTETTTEATQTSEDSSSLEILGRSAILMEATTGKVLYELNPDEQLPPASITKIMTLFLIYEAVEQGKIKWDDMVTVSEHASSMGGSQIFLEPMEQQTVKTMTKSIAIASANDAAVAMAEFLAGSEQEFVKMMNAKAKELGMENTNFENACGLDTDTVNHHMSARDIAIISRELMTKYPEIKEFTMTWQDTITHSTKKGETEFGLTNTNKLLKMYDGATGLKTGSTSKALYCLSGTAERDGLSLIAVIMGAPDPKARFQEVANMLDYGFANYQVLEIDTQGKEIGEIQVYKGEKDVVKGVTEQAVNVVIKKGGSTEVDKQVELIESIKAPVEKGAKLGEVVYTYNGEVVGKTNVIAGEDIEKAGLADIFKKLIVQWVM